MTFKEDFLKDTLDPRAWFDPDTFGRMLNIEGRKVLGIFTSHEADNPMPGTEGYAVREMRLYVLRRDVKLFTAGQSVRVEGAVYVVKDCLIVGGSVWKVTLQAVDG